MENPFDVSDFLGFVGFGVGMWALTESDNSYGGGYQRDRFINTTADRPHENIIGQNERRADKNTFAYGLRIREGHTVGIDANTDHHKHREPTVPR